MKSILTRSGIFLFIIFFLACNENSASVDDDPNGNETENGTVAGKVQCANQGIEGVVVTDGYNFTVTDANGSYSFTPGMLATHIYISSPSGYLVPVVNSVPKFYISLKDVNDRKNINFELVKMATSDQKHYFIAIGDPQVRNEDEIQKLKPILECLKSDITSKSMVPVHLMVTGDIVFDTPLLHDQSKACFSLVDQPVYYCIGNHDHLQNKKQAASDNYDKQAASTYISHYGPTYYSFNRGQVHYIIFDNIFYRGGPDTDYSVKITQEQLNWIKKDLSYVSKDKVLILMSHSPTKSRVLSVYGNCGELHEMLNGYKDVHIITGHTHYNSVVVDNTGISEHIIGAACGGWWEGPVCPDGAYLGYKIFEIDGTTVKWKYKACEMPEKQFSVFKPGPRASYLRPAEELLVNVWDWDASWTVNWSEDNGSTFKPMFRYAAKTYDPTAVQYFGIDGDNTFPAGRTWIDAGPTDHIFTCVPSSGTKHIIIKVANHFGETFTETVDL